MKFFKKSNKGVIIKPANWRQLAYSLFLFLVAVFFSFISEFGLFVSWFGTIAFVFFGLLNLLDLIFVWSRLLINTDGYNLRGWFMRKEYKHEEIESFTLQKYGNRSLPVVNLKKKAAGIHTLDKKSVAFPCTFGNPIEDVIDLLNKNLNKAPRKRK